MEQKNRHDNSLMKKKIKISLVLLTLNEIEGLKIILPQILKHKKKVDEILAIDGGSTDGSKEYLLKNKIKVVNQNKKYSRYEISILKKNIMDAYWLGLKKAKHDNVIIPFTPDGNMLPKHLPKLIKLVKKGHEMIIVSRYKNHAKSYDDTLITGLGNFMFTKIVNLFFKLNLTDLLGGYRSVNKRLFKEFKINRKNLRISIHTQLAIGCARNSKKIVEIPGDEKKRIGGTAQVNPLINGLWEVYTILEAVIKRNLYRNIN
tara:strand:- start:10 stop:789 length:780 start_codon:yes stop_codon:yes gene_type:complete